MLFRSDGQLAFNRIIVAVTKVVFKRFVKANLKHNKEVTLETIRVGDNPPDISYERSIIKQGADFNIKVKRNVLAKNATMDAILSVIDRANRDDKIDGIMMFRPLLSPHLDQKLAENFIIAEKDVDGITRASIKIGRAHV